MTCDAETANNRVSTANTANNTRRPTVTGLHPALSDQHVLSEQHVCCLELVYIIYSYLCLFLSNKNWKKMTIRTINSESEKTRLALVTTADLTAYTLDLSHRSRFAVLSGIDPKI